MNTILKVRFSAIDYYTMKKVSITKTITCNDGTVFKDTTIDSITVNNGKFKLPAVTLSANKKASDWVGEQTDILNDLIYNNKRELKCILDWEILSISSNEKNTINEKMLPIIAKKIKLTDEDKINSALSIIENDGGYKMSDELKANFKHVYNEMKESLVGLSISKKISIVFSALGVGLQASTTAYERISNILNDDEKKLASLDPDALSSTIRHLDGS